MGNMINASPTKSFTLVELLAVIAILSMLAALLLPSLKKAQESTRSIQCVNNLRQHYLACLTYSADNDGFCLPYYYGTPTKIWSAILLSKGYLPGKFVLGSWILSKKQLRCPSNPAGFYPDSDVPNSFYYVNHIGGYPNYMYNGNAGGNIGEPIRKTGSVVSPARKLMFMDVGFTAAFGVPNMTTYVFSTYEGYFDPANTAYLVGNVHSGHCNAIFWDGHVEPMLKGVPKASMADLDNP
jgi:prepilin-type processing-associated H-X9-DG protein/prepilin-type N-terminal cleavage/methylation domain-containing protein